VRAIELSDFKALAAKPSPDVHFHSFETPTATMFSSVPQKWFLVPRFFSNKLACVGVLPTHIGPFAVGEILVRSSMKGWEI